MRFEEACGGWRFRRPTQEEAARLRGVRMHRVPPRSLYPQKRVAGVPALDHYEDEGFDRLLDERLRQVSSRRASVDEVVRTETLYRGRYEGCDVRDLARFRG